MEQKQLGISDDCLSIQIKAGLNGVSKDDASKLWIAYEPVWAIGVNGIPAAEYADEKQGVIKNALKELFGEISDDIPVLYGGSVNLIMQQNDPETQYRWIIYRQKRMGRQ